MTPREVAAVGLAAFVGVPALLLLLAGPTFFTRPFWEDEVFTWLIASDPDAAHAMAALAGGVDTNGPLLHLALRGVGAIFGHAPVVYRSAAMVAMSAAILGLYLTLRLTLARPASAFGGLFLLALPLTITHATEARFYAPLLAAAVWTAYGVARRRRGGGGVVSAAGLSLAAIALCGVHYFGLIALGAIAAVDCLTDRLGFDRAAMLARVRRLLPLLPGVAMMACCWPLFRTQRATAASAGGTWIVDDFALNLLTTIDGVLPAVPMLLGIAVIVVAIARGLPRLRPTLAEAARSPMAAFWLYAATLLAFDRLVQPVLVPRYFILLLPAIAALLAAVVATLPRRRFVAVMTATAAVAIGQLIHVRMRLAAPSPRSAMGILAAAPADDSVVVTDWLAYALPLWAAEPTRGRVLYLPDRRVGTPDLAQSIAYERRMGQMVTAFYGLPTVRDVDHVDAFVFLSPFPETVDVLLPGRQIRPRTEIAYDVRRADVADASSP